jgi:hypothetical protein
MYFSSFITSEVAEYSAGPDRIELNSWRISDFFLVQRVDDVKHREKPPAAKAIAPAPETDSEKLSAWYERRRGISMGEAPPSGSKECG